MERKKQEKKSLRYLSSLKEDASDSKINFHQILIILWIQLRIHLKRNIIIV